MQSHPVHPPGGAYRVVEMGRRSDAPKRNEATRPAVIPRRLRREALGLWLVFLGFAMINGFFRQRVLEPNLGPEPAHFLDDDARGLRLHRDPALHRPPLRGSSDHGARRNRDSLGGMDGASRARLGTGPGPACDAPLPRLRLHPGPYLRPGYPGRAALPGPDRVTSSSGWRRGSDQSVLIREDHRGEFGVHIELLENALDDCGLSPGK